MTKVHVHQKILKIQLHRACTDCKCIGSG